MLAQQVARDPSGFWLGYALPVVYAAATHAGGAWLLLTRAERSGAHCALAVLAVAHGRVVASYLVHEATHSAIFRSLRANTAYGVFCQWCAGSPYCYFPFVRKLHIAHHYDRADTVGFDYRAKLAAGPAPLRCVVLALEWAYVPAVDCLLHARSMLAPLATPGTPLAHRATALTGTAAVVALLASLHAWGGPASLALYLLACMLQLHVLQMHDAFQHTFQVLVPGPAYVSGPGPRTAQYEEENTYSNLISTRWPLLNVLSLNFGHHNAHHRKPMTPWYRLPALHLEMYGSTGGNVDCSPQVLPFRELLQTWHANRLRRVLEEDYGFVAKDGNDRARAFIGSVGVSFLTVF